MKELIDYLKVVKEKTSMLALLSFDVDTKAPKDSIDYYMKMMEDLEKDIFTLTTSKEYEELLNKAIESDEFSNLEEYEQILIKDLKEKYDKQKRIPKTFYISFSNQKNRAKLAWKEAKEKNDYSIFKPYLEKNIEMTKELYKYINPESQNIYDDMLYDFEKGIKSKDIDVLFEELKQEIIPIIKNLKPKKLNKITSDYCYMNSNKISEFLLNYIGFDNNKGALGNYPHGYTTTISSNDVRIAYKETDDIVDLATTIIHEGGHGIFELCAAKSLNKFNLFGVDLLALHESQSRFYENILGRNKNFWEPIYEDFKNLTKIDISIDDYVDYLNNAKPSLLRIEADELTYCLHIIIRYEIEREIFINNLDLDKLPEVWNKKYKEYLGIDIVNDSDGVLQDMHWSDASFGYFPDYLLGSIFDGMLLKKTNEDLGNVDNILKEGRIKEITNYLNNNIHKYAGAYNIFEVCKRVCNENMNVKPLVDYFKKKYER